ncbi:MAG: LamG-like jellyroll fold domain-containing protein, partial [Bacteroidota bacterium]
PDIPTIENNIFSNNTRDIVANPMVLDDEIFDTNGFSVVYIDNTNVTANTTWQKAQLPEVWKYEMIGSVTVDAAATLSLEPGLEVIFTNATQDINVNGTFSALGTVSDSIRFTGAGSTLEVSSSGSFDIEYSVFQGMGISNVAAIRTAGGGTVSNSRFNQSEVAITVNGGASPTITSTTMTNSNDYGIRVDNGSPTISNVTIDDANLGGIWIQAGNPSILGSSISNVGQDGGIWIDTPDIPTIENNIFSNNTRDIVANPMVLDDEIFDTNGFSVVHIDNTNVTANTTWQKAQLPEVWNYEMIGSVTVDAAATLSLEPGLELVFTNATQDINVNGTFSAIGSVSDSIRFTGGGSSITILNVGSFDIDYAVFEQMGISNIAALITSGDGVISNSRFNENEIGITVQGGVSPTLSNLIITNSSDFGVSVSGTGTSPTISNSTIESNGSGLINTGINNTGTGTVTATNNWWGDASGPFNGTSNPSGLGNGVSGNIIFSPFFTSSLLSTSNLSLSFDGTAQYVLLPSAFSVFESPTLTVEAWVNPATATSYIVMAHQTGGWDFYVSGGFLRAARAGIDTYTSSATVPIGVWTHVAITYDNGILRFYKNGVFVEQTTYTLFGSTSDDYDIGGRSTNVQYSEQLIDEVRIWNTVRTDIEIGENYAAELNGSEPGLVGYFPLNDGLGSTLASDLSSSGIDGILTGLDENTDWVSGPAITSVPIPIAPSKLFATEVSQTQVDLNWTDNSLDETAFAIFRSSGNNGSFTEIGTVGEDVTSYADNTVAAGNNYFYFVVARNGGGDSAPSNEKAAATFIPPGNALVFDGSNDYVDLGSNNLSITGDLTLEAWVNISSYAAPRVILARSADGEALAANINYQLRIESDGKVGLFYEYANGADVFATSDNS